MGKKWQSTRHKHCSAVSYELETQTRHRLLSRIVCNSASSLNECVRYWSRLSAISVRRTNAFHNLYDCLQVSTWRIEFIKLLSASIRFIYFATAIGNKSEPAERTRTHVPRLNRVATAQNVTDWLAVPTC